LQSLARLIATPGRRNETALDVPSRALCVGDALTDFGGRVEVGVTQVFAFLLDVGHEEDNLCIVVRVRPTVAVHWELGLVGGVDSGVLGVWDADTRMTDSADTHEDEDHVGAGWVGGRRVFTLRTGDGGFPCVVGRDEKGEVCAVLVGPGIDPERFGAETPDALLTPEERAEKAANEAREARLLAADLLGQKLGERRASKPLRWFVAGWLESLPEADRAAAWAALEPAVERLALPRLKDAKARAQADVTAILGWALSGWSTVLAATMPEVAASIAVPGSIEKGEMGWAHVLGRVYDHKMTDHRYDLTRPYEVPLTRGLWGAWVRAREGREMPEMAAVRDVPADLRSRFGLVGIDVMVEKNKLHRHHQLADALWYASCGLGPALALFVLATRTADLVPFEPTGMTPLRPRDPGYVEEMLARVETPVDFVLRLARRT
jgi:hypothetical protein